MDGHIVAELCELEALELAVAAMAWYETFAVSVHLLSPYPHVVTP